MRDEELREELAAWLRPTQRTRVPDVSVIKRRLRRRRARQAVTGTVLCAVAAGAVVIAHAAAPPPPPPPMKTAVDACTGNQLRAGWAPAPVHDPPGRGTGRPPVTFLLQVHNTGRAACSLAGWPNLTAIPRGAPRGVPLSYGTISPWVTFTRGGVENTASRFVRPTRVALRPGASAASTVTVTYGAMTSGCVRQGWSVRLPGIQKIWKFPAGQPLAAKPVHPGMPAICRESTVVVSPFYPATVPASQDYPAAAPRQSPATVSSSLPVDGAGPQAAPYFAVLDRSKTPSPVVVRDWRTGNVTQVIQPPTGAAQGFTGVAAAGDDRTFVLAAGSRFYQLVLNPQGRLQQPLTPLPVPRVAQAGTPFAVSGDGSELALALPQRGGTLAADEIMVVSLVTGAWHTWRSPDPGTVAGLTWADTGSSHVSGWAGNDRLLFGWTDASQRSGTARRRSGLRLLDITAGGSDLLAARVVVPASARVGALRTINNPLISADGNAVFVTMTSHAGGNAQAAVVKFSTATGRPLAVVTPLADESGMGTWCGALWSDPSGARALAACGVQGRVDQAHFTPQNLHFPVPNLSAGGNFFAW